MARCADVAEGDVRAAHGERHLLREAEALAGGAVALFLALEPALVRTRRAARRTSAARSGTLLADTALRALGVAAYLFPVYLGYRRGRAAARRRATTSAARGSAARCCSSAASRRSAGLVDGRHGQRCAAAAGSGGFLGTALARPASAARARPRDRRSSLVVALVLATGVSAFDMAAGIGALDRRRRGVRAGTWVVRARPARIAGAAGDGAGAGAAPRTRARPIRARRCHRRRLRQAGADRDARPPPPIIREPERKPEPPASGSAAAARDAGGAVRRGHLPAAAAQPPRRAACDRAADRRGGAARELAHPRDEARRLRRRRQGRRGAARAR